MFGVLPDPGTAVAVGEPRRDLYAYGKGQPYQYK
jgi:hypothetical protein